MGNPGAVAVVGAFAGVDSGGFLAFVDVDLDCGLSCICCRKPRNCKRTAAVRN